MSDIVIVDRVEGTGMITIRCDLTNKTLATAIKSVAGLPMPKVNTIESNGDNAVAWMSPDELLVLVPHENVAATVEALRKKLSKTHALVQDVSDARAHFELGGSWVRDAVSKLTPANLDAGHFGPGSFRRTRLAQAAAAIWMEENDVISVICFSSLAKYMQQILENAADNGPVNVN